MPDYKNNLFVIQGFLQEACIAARLNYARHTPMCGRRFSPEDELDSTIDALIFDAGLSQP